MNTSKRARSTFYITKILKQLTIIVVGLALSVLKLK